MADPRDDVVTFAREVLRVEPFPHTHELLRCRKPVIANVGGRRSCKSFSAQLKTSFVAATNRDADVYISHPNIDNASYWLAELAQLLRGSRLRDSVEVQARKITFHSTGSRIEAIPETPGQMRGRGRRVLLWVLEECGFSDPRVITDVRYTLMDRHAEGAQLWMVSSPWGGPDHPLRVAFERGQDGDEDYAAFRFRMTDNPRLSRAFIERERDRVAPSEALAEIDGEWADHAGSLFPRQLLQRATVPIEQPDLAKTAIRGNIIGVDWAAGGDDHCAVVSLSRVPFAQLNPDDLPYRPVFLATAKVWPVASLMRNVLDDICGWPMQPRYIASETNGVGAMPSQELRHRLDGGWKKSWDLIHTSQATKTAGYMLVKHLLERDQLLLAPHVELMRQLAGIRFEQQARGFLKVEASDESTHDDVTDALCALATLPRRVNGRVGCVLQRFASPDQAVPDTPLPPGYDGGAIVESGGGVRTFRQPVLQAVSSSELTLPRRVNPEQPVQIGSLTYTPRR